MAWQPNLTFKRHSAGQWEIHHLRIIMSPTKYSWLYIPVAEYFIALHLQFCHLSAFLGGNR